MAMFKPPVGTPPERDKCMVWPKGWRNSNGFGGGPSGKTYSVNNRNMGHHTGVDLVRSDSQPTLRQPVFAIGPGRVTFAQDVPINTSETWGKVIVIYHGEVEKGVQLFSRYAHLASMSVQKNDEVTADSRIGLIGSGPAGSGMAAHLHFDISVNNTLQANALDWPRDAKALVDRNYRDPEIWFTEAHTLIKDANGKSISAGQPAAAGGKVQAMPPASIVPWYVTARNGTQIRRELSIPKEAILPYRFDVPLLVDPQPFLHENHFWVQVASGPLNGSWVKYSNQTKNELYLSTVKPP